MPRKTEGETHNASYMCVKGRSYTIDIGTKARPKEATFVVFEGIFKGWHVEHVVGQHGEMVALVKHKIDIRQ